MWKKNANTKEYCSTIQSNYFWFSCKLKSCSHDDFPFQLPGYLFSSYNVMSFGILRNAWMLFLLLTSNRYSELPFTICMNSSPKTLKYWKRKQILTIKSLSCISSYSVSHAHNQNPQISEITNATLRERIKRTKMINRYIYLLAYKYTYKMNVYDDAIAFIRIEIYTTNIYIGAVLLLQNYRNMYKGEHYLHFVLSMSSSMIMLMLILIECEYQQSSRHERNPIFFSSMCNFYYKTLKLFRRNVDYWE